MQIVAPIDIEAAVAAELGAVMEDKAVTAWPPPDRFGAGTVCIMSLGGFEQTPVSDGYDIVAYAYEATYSEAYKTAFEACAIIRALRFNASASGHTFSTSEARPPYEDPDPDRQTLKRCTVRATVSVRGAGIIDHQ